jgi:dTDP-4-amino-4,6-dideoxygalactose transaminase
VLTSTLTFAATANAITYVGATPVFIDAARDLDDGRGSARGRAGRARRSGRMPAAVLAVDLYGQCCDYDRLIAVCDEYGVPVIEDAAEALGASCGGRQAGAFGACAAFSFNGNKIITTGGGGMLVSHERAARARAATWPRRLATPRRTTSTPTIGFNYRLSNLLAAVGRGQLAGLTEGWHGAVRSDALRGGARPSARRRFLPEAPYGRSNAWLTCLTVDPQQFGATSEDIRLHLESLASKRGPVWKPMHLQPVFRDCRVRGGGVAERLLSHGLVPAERIGHDPPTRLVSLRRSPACCGTRLSVRRPPSRKGPPVSDILLRVAALIGRIHRPVALAVQLGLVVLSNRLAFLLGSTRPAALGGARRSG